MKVQNEKQLLGQMEAAIQRWQTGHFNGHAYQLALQRDIDADGHLLPRIFVHLDDDTVDFAKDADRLAFRRLKEDINAKLLASFDARAVFTITTPKDRKYVAPIA